MTTVHNYQVNTLRGEAKSLRDFKGNALLIVNVASQCGLTPQYAGLQRLYDKYRDRGFFVLGFPCNDFGSQEPGTATEIQAFCETQYRITFPLFSKIHVRGAECEPLYKHLTRQTAQPEGAGEIVWNFTKFVVDQKGSVVARYSPQTEPFDQDLLQTIEDTLRTDRPTDKPMG